MFRAILALVFAWCALFPATATGQCTMDTQCKGDRICVAGACTDPEPAAPQPKPKPKTSSLTDPAQIIVNDREHFAIRVGPEEFANLWAYERLDVAHARKWRNRRLGSGVITAVGAGIGYLGLQSATLWAVTALAIGFVGTTNDPLFYGWGIGSLVAMIGGGALAYHGVTRSKHPYTPAERMEIVGEFNGRRFPTKLE